jgi:hypothetical protein
LIFKYFHNVSNGRSLLSNSYVNAVKSLGIVRVRVIEGSLLVDDSINGNSCLSSLSITDDQLSLTSSNRNL